MYMDVPACASAAMISYLFRITQEPAVSFLLPLIQEGKLSATGESMCMKYWFKTAVEV